MTAGPDGGRISVSQSTDLMNSNGDVVGRLEPGSRYPVLQAVEGWFETQDTAGRSGWVEAAVVEVTAAPLSPPAGAGSRVCHVDHPVEVRSLQDTSTVAGHLLPGTRYNVHSESQGWVQVSDGAGLVGWASSEQVTVQQVAAVPPTAPVPQPPPSSVPTHVVPSQGLPAWSAPDPSAPTVATLAGGTPLTLVTEEGAWARVRAETGWEGWVDGRLLLARAGAGPAIDPSTRAAGGESGARDRVVVALRERPLPLAASLALLISPFVSWVGGYAGNADGYDIPLTFLYSLTATSTTLNLGMLVLALAAVGLAVTVFDHTDRAALLLRVVGGVALAAGAIFLVQFARTLAQQDGWGTIIPDLFFKGFAIGPYLAIAAGITLLWLPHRITLEE